MLSLIGLLMFAAPALNAGAAWKNTSAGRIYTQTAAPGYVTGMKKIGKYWYFFNNKGIMQKGVFKTVNKKTYYFRKKDGRRYNAGWLTYKKKKYYFNKDGVMLTGMLKVKNKYYYLNGKGVMQKGWIRTTNGSYYANPTTGVLAVNQWVGDYYFLANCRMAVNTWIDGKWVGADGRYTGVRNNVGWVKDNGKTYYYDTNSKLVKGWLNLKGKTYYLHPSTGVLQKGWMTIGGSKYYAANNGVIQKSKWVNGKYLNSNGVMATGVTTIDGQTYCFDTSGNKRTGWIVYNKNNHYFNSDGILQKSAWIEKRYVNSSGVMVTGFAKIGKYTYYLNPSDGVKHTGWLTLNGNKYFFSKKGVLYRNNWLPSKNYYAGSNGALLKGLNAVSTNIYYFDPVTCMKAVSTMKTIGADTYYFQKTGIASKNAWVKINSKFYYFQSTGKLAKSMWVGKYYVDENGVRTDRQLKTGWDTVNGQVYYFNENGKPTTGFAAISGSTYYFNETGVMQTGIQSISGKKYYFYSDGRMAVSLTIIIGAKQYTINASGVITNETSIRVDSNSKGAQIVNYALQFVGNKYVYGGTDPVNGADCSGFVMTVFKHFGYTLLRVADDQMHGPTDYYIKLGYTKAVTVDIDSIQPGDLLFYGSGDYASHVALYMGNGQIVHASNSQPYPKGDIKISNYDYQTPLKAVRYWS